MPRDPRKAVLLLVLLLACAGRGGRSPWPQPEGAGPRPLAHAEVKTLNPGYKRQESAVLVRKIDRPTRANLDFAAYHANFMVAEPPPEDERQTGGAPKFDARNVFRGLIAADTLTGLVGGTPLTADERVRPLALAPLAQWMSGKQAALAGGLEDLLSAVREESWGLGAGPPLPRQQATELFLHDVGAGKPPELWVRIEFAPWWKGWRDLPDEDGDGSPELYGRARADLLSDKALALVRDDYAGRVLAAAEVHSWAHKLASYWYPSYNTDLASVGPSWPDDQTEAPVKAQLGELRLQAPTVVMRGKPHGEPTYNVFLVEGVPAKGATGAAGPAGQVGQASKADRKGKYQPTPEPKPLARKIEGELAAAGGSWEQWQKQVAPFQGAVRKHLKSAPAAIKALPGQDGFLFYRAALEYAVGGDLEKQPRKKNPVQVITQWKTFLAERGVDFLFVPVPTKAEIFPDKLDPAGAPLKGKVVNPYARKLLLGLSRAGVEVVDLWTPFLQARGKGDLPEPLFQRQDTHWTSRGLELAASVIAERIARYPWAGELAANKQTLGVRPASFARYGDLHSRLKDSQRKGLTPEALTAQQVLGPDGQPYVDDEQSPIVVLGDSFTAVYQLMDCEHAGLSAHLARDLGRPVDLVMSYGGGPNVRHKLMRRGEQALRSKRLVIWVMTARDLYNYWEDWEPLKPSRGVSQR